MIWLLHELPHINVTYHIVYTWDDSHKVVTWLRWWVMWSICRYKRAMSLWLPQVGHVTIAVLSVDGLSLYPCVLCNHCIYLSLIIYTKLESKYWSVDKDVNCMTTVKYNNYCYQQWGKHPWYLLLKTIYIFLLLFFYIIENHDCTVMSWMMSCCTHDNYHWNLWL